MDKNDLIREIQIALAHDNLLDFMLYVRQSSKPFLVGRHTKEITERLDRAIDDYRNGISSYLIVTVAPRHGKSEIISRHFPPYVLGHFPDAEIMLSTYAQTLSNGMSRDARNVIKSERYRQVFHKENIQLSDESSAVENWEIAGHRGKFQASGIGGSSTGKGADVLIIDDYLKGRSDAESKTIRDGMWDDFSGNLMTRLAPVHIVIILATRWHVDDIIGRCFNCMDPEHKDYQEDFPQFEVMKFPARDDDGNFLFPERFSATWYNTQFAVLGKYQSAALMQCDPIIRGGNMFKTDNVQIVDEMPDSLRWCRFWDLASTEKERSKNDPDYTAGALVAVKKIDGQYHLYIKDVRYCQSESPARNKLIRQTSDIDGSRVQIGVESVAGYKDTYTTLKDILSGTRIVKKVTVSKDKVVRASALEPLFEAGHVYMLRADWNHHVIDELSQFPSGVHDDIVDAIASGYEMAKNMQLPSRML